MAKTRALLLALALEASSGAGPRLLSFRRPKDCYVSTLLLRPEDYRLMGLVQQQDGIALLWQYTGPIRLHTMV